MAATWNWLDWILAAIVLISVLSAYAKGFTRELIALASVVVGLIVAALYYERAAAWFQDMTSSRQVALGIGFLTLFLAVLIVGALISALAKKLIKTAGLQWFDHLLGAAFGLVLGIVVDSVLLLALVAFAIKPDVVQRSQLAPYVTTGARALAVVMPAELKADFRTGFQKLRDALLEGSKPHAK